MVTPEAPMSQRTVEIGLAQKNSGYTVGVSMEGSCGKHMCDTHNRNDKESSVQLAACRPCESNIQVSSFQLANSPHTANDQDQDE
jgi:hypothetical protein